MKKLTLAALLAAVTAFAQITVLQPTDLVSNSRVVINNNFAYVAAQASAANAAATAASAAAAAAAANSVTGVIAGTGLSGGGGPGSVTLTCGIATTVSIGCVRPDGSTIVVAGGVISSTGGSGASDWITQISNKPFVDSRQFNFGSQTPGGSLAIGANNVVMTPVPVGVNGSDGQHYLYVSGGTGTAEGCLITGGAGISGTNGTIVLTCAHTHTGAWTVSSASGGIKEAAVANSAALISAPVGVLPIHATLVLPTTVSLVGQGSSTAFPVVLGTVLACDIAANPCVVLADGLASVAGQGIGLHTGYTISSATGPGGSYGLWLGGDPANVFAPSSWAGSFIHFQGVVTNFDVGITLYRGDFDQFTGGESNSITTGFWIPSTNNGSQPIEFRNFLLSALQGGNGILQDASGFVTGLIHYSGGQVSGQVAGAQVSVDAEGVHFEPSGTGYIVNVSANGSHRFRASGGLMSVHPGLGMTQDAMVKFSGTGFYDVQLDGILIQVDSGATATNYVSLTTSNGGSLVVNGIKEQPAGAINSLYAIGGSAVDSVSKNISHAPYSNAQITPAAATLVFPQGNFPQRAELEVSGATVGGGGITAVSGLIQGQVGILHTDNVQTFAAGATIGIALTTVAFQPYTYYYQAGVLWIR